MTTPFNLGNEIVYLHTTAWQDTGIVYLNVHENEQTSVEAAKQVLPVTGGILVELKHKGERLISFDGDDNTHYIFDPNRMFSAEGIRNSLLENGPYSEVAEHIIARFADAVLQEVLSHNPKLVVALHNTTGDYSMYNYIPGGDLENDKDDMHINPQHHHTDMFFTTSRSMFEHVKHANYNAVLQHNDNVVNDGSLSVYFSQHHIPYINTEALNGHVQEQMEMIQLLHNMMN